MDIMVRIKAPGGPEALQVVECPPQAPGAGEIRVRQRAVGVNFIDIYHRTGLHPLPPPAVPGVEGAGIVEAVGPGVAHLKAGDRIAYAGLPGAYASTRLIPAWRAVPLPVDIDFGIAAASMLRGLTVHMLLTLTFPATAGTVLLVHAAAGGLGVMLTRQAKRLGAQVIGTASTPEKAAIAMRHGADHVIVGRDADIVGEVAALTSGKGVDFAIDGIGGDLLRRSLGCVRPFGVLANIGWVAGRVPPVDIEELGSVMLAKPSVMAYSADRAYYASGTRAVLEALEAGIVADMGGEYRLADAAGAQTALETGRTTGSLVLVP